MNQTNDNLDEGSVPNNIICPKCGSSQINRLLDTVDDANPLKAHCQNCGHIWHIDTDPDPLPAGEAVTLARVLSDEQIQVTAENSPDLSVVEVPRIQVDGSKVMIPQPLFWGLLLFILALVGISAYLWVEKNREDQALAITKIIQATDMAANRATATQQAASKAATGTAEAWMIAATGTATADEALIIAATGTAQWQATGTAQSQAIALNETTTAQQQAATATSERAATIESQLTATAQIKTTATAEAVATNSAQATIEVDRIRTATAEFVATVSVGTTATAEWNATATSEARVTPTPTPILNVIILGCDTGVDVLSQRGEVTNAWVTIQNPGVVSLTDVEVTLISSDENRDNQHPDKSESLANLSAQQQITFKLTVDTEWGRASDITVIVNSAEGVTELDKRASCKALDENAKKLISYAGEIATVLPLKILSIK